MKFEFDPEADAVYIKLSEKHYSRGKDIDDKRRIDFAADGSPIGVELLGVSHGVNVSSLPFSADIQKMLEDRDIMACSIEDLSSIYAVAEGTTVFMVTCSAPAAHKIFEPVDVRPTFNFQFAKYERELVTK